MIRVDFEKMGSKLTLHVSGDTARLHVRNAYFAAKPGTDYRGEDQYLSPRQALELAAALHAWGEHQQGLLEAARARKKARAKA